LKNLRQKVHKHTTTASVNLTLPIRPQDLSTDVNPYIDDALGMLSDSTSHLYDDDAPWAVRVMEVKKGVERVDAKVDEVKTEVAEIKTEVAEIKTEMRSLEERLTVQVDDVRVQVDNVRVQVDDIRASLRNQMAVQLNSLQTELSDYIEPVSAPIQVKGCERYIVAKGFPDRVKDFWKLVLDLTVLTELARHYSVRNWDRWKRATSRDIDVSCYTELEDAVTAHPYKCLKALAKRWGLKYDSLDRLRTPLRQEGQLGKRKAETDSELRRVKARNDSASQAESTSSQDDDDQGSQVISVRVPTGRIGQGQYAGIVFLEPSPTNEEGYREPSERSRVFWRCQSTSTERQRRRLYDNNRSQDRSSRDRSSRERTPKEELSRLAPSEEPSESATRPFSSTVPFGTSTQEELQLRRPVSRSSKGEEETEH